MDYKVIVVSNEYESNAVNQLDQQVNKYIYSGWKPFGGVSVSRSDTVGFQKTVLAQAMIKE